MKPSDVDGLTAREAAARALEWVLEQTYVSVVLKLRLPRKIAEFRAAPTPRPISYMGDTSGTPMGPSDPPDEPGISEIWRQAERREKDWREAGEVTHLKTMFEAYQALKACGWKEAMYCPKDGTRFLAIEAGSTGVHVCYYQGEWPDGHWWIEAAGDPWPARPILWKAMP